MSSTGDQGGTGGGRGGGEVVNVGPLTPVRQVGARSPKMASKRNGRRNPSLRALSEKEPKRKEKKRKKHNLGSTRKASASSTEFLSVEVVKQGVRDCRNPEVKKSATSSTTSVKMEDGGSPFPVEATSNKRGVRKRPGVKGFLVEIRPKRWKTTIWLGTFNTLCEACRAFDAGIFYTKKPWPFNYPDSEGSFPNLPTHLSLRIDEDPTKLKEATNFIKEQALKASKRAIGAVTVDSLECSLDSSIYSDAGPNSSSRLEKVAKTTESCCGPVTPKDEEEEEEHEHEQEKEKEDEEEEQAHVQIQNVKTEEVIKHVDSLVHLYTGEVGDLSSSQDDMGEGSVFPEEGNLDTMTKDSESSLQKFWDDEQMLVSPGSHVEGALSVEDPSCFKYFLPELMTLWNDIAQPEALQRKSNVKFETLYIAGFSIDPPELFTQEGYMKSSISDNLDTQLHTDDLDEICLWSHTVNMG